jgi:tetratricopeptide (TPR) repeat protein
MRRRMRSMLITAVLLLTLPAFAAPPTPEQREQARQRYDAASRKFDLGRYDEAAEDFEAAYELVGDPKILFNIAQSFRLGQKYEKALRFYRSYLNKDPGSKNRSLVEKRIAELTELVDRQRSEAQAPPQGTIRPEETPPDKSTTTTTETTPPPSASIAPPAEPAQTPTRPPRALKIAGFSLGGLAVASLVVGATFSALAASANDDIVRANQARTGAWTQTLKDEDANGRTYDAVAIAAYVVGGAAAVASAVTLAIAYRRPHADRVARVQPLLGRDLAGLCFEGRF